MFVATAAMVVEVVSPGDETLEKLAFYASRGVEEVVVADPARGSLRSSPGPDCAALRGVRNEQECNALLQ